MREIKIGKKYRHFKGNIVEVTCIAKDSETLEELVVYHHINTEEYWVRPKTMFASEVDHEKYPDVKQQYRFEEIEE